MICKKCELLDQVFSKEIESNYEYWLYTELFVYLHGGADHCKENKESYGFNEKDIKETKMKCLKCGMLKKIEDFYYNRKMCKECTNKYWEKSIKENKHDLESTRKWFQDL